MVLYQKIEKYVLTFVNTYDIVRVWKLTNVNTKEKIEMTVKFVLGFASGLNTSIDEVLTETEFWKQELPANTSWNHVEVASLADKYTYISAQNRYLAAAWTPNQNAEEREENGVIMAEAEAEMKRLRIN